MDVGLLVLRLALGGALLLQGASKLTGPGRRDTASFFEGNGLHPPVLLASVAGASEVTAAALLLVGLATPLAAAAAVGVLVTAAVVVGKNGYWNSAGGAEYPLVLTATAAAIAFVGPGSWSVDHVLGWSDPAPTLAALAVAGGALSAVPLLARRTRRLATAVPAAGASA